VAFELTRIRLRASAERPSWPLGDVTRTLVGGFEQGRDIRILQQGLGPEVPVPAPPVAQAEDASLDVGRKMQLGGNGRLLAAAFAAAGA
jgi:hypothetical protein